jgi:hypothetical protein
MCYIRLATLTLIEEAELDPTDPTSRHQQVREWLKDSKSQDVLRRLNKAANKVVASLGGELSADRANEILFTKSLDLQKMMLKYEGTQIKQALIQANGSVTHAAPQPGVSYQALCYAIRIKTQDLIKDRAPIHRRQKTGGKFLCAEKRIRR